MAVEAKRGCGYRKIGGLYLVGGGIGVPCDRLPISLSICPCCGQGIKQSRGWTWVDVNKLVDGVHRVNAPTPDYLPKGVNGLQPCDCGVELRPTVEMDCPLCKYPELLGRAGLLWIGEQFYKTPGQFVAEGVALGFSRRIRTVPRGFKPGETWVLLAHPKAVTVAEPVGTDPLFPNATEIKFKPGIFYLWLPQRLEKILPESKQGSEKVAELEKRGITPVFVPDDDPDHQGSVFDKEEEALFK
jgi:hypothetical protein